MFSQNSMLLASADLEYSFGQNESNTVDYKVLEEEVSLVVLEIDSRGPEDGLWEFLFSAKDRKGFGGVLLMLSSAGSAAVALGESGGKQNNFLLGAVALGATGLYLYNSHLNENTIPRRAKEKKKYKPSDWEIVEE